MEIIVTAREDFNLRVGSQAKRPTSPNRTFRPLAACPGVARFWRLVARALRPSTRADQQDIFMESDPVPSGELSPRGWLARLVRGAPDPGPPGAGEAVATVDGLSAFRSEEGPAGQE